jgi:hypothetical protein
MQLVTNNSAIIDRSTVASALAKATTALLAARNPLQSFLGVAVVAVGFPFYSLVFPARRATQRAES